jgi:DNA polymerase III delta subunit
MYYFFTGTDTNALREKLAAAAEKAAGKARIVRITDAQSLADLDAALQGPGLFGEQRVIVLDNVTLADPLRERFLASLPRIAESEEHFFVLETDIDATTRKIIEKHAEKTERLDAGKKAKDNSIFGLANALQRGQKKELWVGYQRELMKGSAPEAIHGTLFWAAKQAILRSNTDKNRALVAALAELPHEARRRGFDLEYALELFVLSVA